MRRSLFIVAVLAAAACQSRSGAVEPDRDAPAARARAEPPAQAPAEQIALTPLRPLDEGTWPDFKQAFGVDRERMRLVVALSPT